MLFESRAEKRKVSETLDSVLLPLIIHMKDEEAILLHRAMEIVRNTDTKEEKNV